MARDFTAVICNDLQAPYHDPRAVDVAGQIGEAAKPDLLDLNGDLVDLRCISRYPLTHDEEDPRIIHSLSEEIDKSKACLKALVRGIKAKKTRARDGNHEWRIQRAFEKDDKALRVIGLRIVKASLCSAAILDFPSMGIEYAGSYPSGSWLHPGLPASENIWVEHGYMTRVKAGYVAQGLMEKRMASVIVGHCEKLALVWRRSLDRDMFAIENGNLSLIGESQGKGLYGGVPHSCPEYMDHRQGMSVVTYSGGQWWPELVKIRDGKAWFRGKLYSA